MSKPTVHQALAELRRVSFRFDVWPKGRRERSLHVPPALHQAGRRDGLARAVARGQGQGLGMCLECATVALEKHRALVFDIEVRRGGST